MLNVDPHAYVTHIIGINKGYIDNAVTNMDIMNCHYIEAVPTPISILKIFVEIHKAEKFNFKLMSSANDNSLNNSVVTSRSNLLVTRCLKLIYTDFMQCSIKSTWWLIHSITTYLYSVCCHIYSNTWTPSKPLRNVKKYPIMNVHMCSFFSSSLLFNLMIQTPYW